MTGSFPIAADVYERVWHPTLDVFFPVQMDHMFVNEALPRVARRGAPRRRACRRRSTSSTSTATGRAPTTNTPYKPGERIPGLAVGGWFDAGDFDIQGGSHAVTVSSFVATWETFRPQHDQTLVDQAPALRRHPPAGRQARRAAADRARARCRSQRSTAPSAAWCAGIVDGELHRYHHLGDGSTQTDNLIYDPSLKPYESDGTAAAARPTTGGSTRTRRRSRTTRGSARWPRPAGRCGASTTRSRPSASRSRRRRTPRSGPAPRPPAAGDAASARRSASSPS